MQIKSKWGIIINRSNWNDIFVKHVARWCARKTGLSKKFTGSTYEMIIRKTNVRRYNGVSNCFHRASITISRRYIDAFKKPFLDRYWTYKWSKPFEVWSTVELFVMLMCHEMLHSTTGRPRLFKSKQQCESYTHREAHRLVEQWRKERNVIMSRILADMRKDRAARKAKKSKPSTSDKLAKSEAMLRKWQAKLKLAQTKVNKYKRSVAACTRHIERTAAK